MTDAAPHGDRLQKVLARAGYGSRRVCEELIRAGRVRVNGEIALLGSRVDPLTDEVSVDGVRAAIAPQLLYIALHKPIGVVTAARDRRGRPTVLDLVPKDPRLFPVGRLDIETSGLLLMTNDGDFANRIAHPRYEVPKTYVARVHGAITGNLPKKLARGVELEDGLARAESVSVQASSQLRSIVELTVREGRNRLVRRMLESVGLEVNDLVRTAIGPVRLGRLKEGTWRNLKPQELHQLLALTQDLD